MAKPSPGLEIVTAMPIDATILTNLDRFIGVTLWVRCEEQERQKSGGLGKPRAEEREVVKRPPRRQSHFSAALGESLRGSAARRGGLPSGRCGEGSKRRVFAIPSVQ
jgi:hypothetical protein